MIQEVVGVQDSRFRSVGLYEADSGGRRVACTEFIMKAGGLEEDSSEQTTITVGARSLNNDKVWKQKASCYFLSLLYCTVRISA